MSSVVPPRRPIVLKASRDTLVLLVAASGMALAIGYSVHSRPAPSGAPQTTEQTGEWAGQLAALAPAEVTAPVPAEPLSSDGLTVPKAAMALPAPPKPTGAAKPRGCDGAACAPPPAKTAAAPILGAPGTAPAPNQRPTVALHAHPVREVSLVDRLNPLNHLPDMVKRPFASAGDTIAGWVKRF